MSPPLRRVDRAKAEVVEGVEPFIPNQDHGAAMATITAGGTSSGHVLLSAKGDATVTSTSGADMNCGFV